MNGKGHSKSAAGRSGSSLDPRTNDVSLNGSAMVLFRSSNRGDGMSKKELVRLVSRALSVFFASWAFADITYLPQEFFELSHHLKHASVLVGEDYLAKYYSLLTFFTLVRMLVFFLAAIWFWCSGKRVEGLLSPSLPDHESANQM